MKSKSLIVVRHRSGKWHIYSERAYKALIVLKNTLAAVVAIGIMLLMCGMVVCDDSPIMPLQLVMTLGIGLFLGISLLLVHMGEKNKNSNFRRKTK